MAQVVKVRHNGAVVPISALTLDDTLCGGEEIYRCGVAGGVLLRGSCCPSHR
jgi:hypothetical protein